MKVITSAVFAALVGAAGAQAEVGFAGGDISLSYGGLSEYDDIHTTSTDVNLAFEINPVYDIQVSVGNHSIGNSGFSYSSNSTAVHGIYNFANAGRAGIMYETGSFFMGANIDAYGLEYQFSNGAFDAEIQAGILDFGSFGPDDNYTFLNANASYDFDRFNIGLGVFGLFYQDENLIMTTAHAGYDVPNFGVELFAEYSNLSYSSGPDSMDMWQIGVKIPFGAGNKDPFDSPLGNMQSGFLVGA